VDGFFLYQESVKVSKAEIVVLGFEVELVGRNKNDFAKVKSSQGAIKVALCNFP
jgi:hypothetical protein